MSSRTIKAKLFQNSRNYIALFSLLSLLGQIVFPFKKTEPWVRSLSCFWSPDS